ncbi:MAG: hypothetical protein COB35_02265 [Gammaproteobacteria bacterium]|nr:MAG: hypothetical protein COB35_02265 [Gammaproteobacteria bacterium]
MLYNATSFENEDDFRLWLNSYDPNDQAPEDLIRRFMDGVNLLGIDIYRASMWLPTFHPELWGTQIVWTRNKATEIFRRDHNITSTPTYLNTPGEAIHKTRKSLRWRLTVPDEELPFPLLCEVKAAGGTDYLIVPFDTADLKEQPWITFTTKRAGGFSEFEIKILKELCIPLGWKARVTMAEFSTKSLLGVYLGENAAQRVINGQFKRGTGESINAIIWYCDLRGFTRLSEQYTSTALVNILDQYFECTASAIEASGGEILKFIGDAVLAVFPLTDPLSQCCENALTAAETALDNLAMWSKQQSQYPALTLQAGVALHIGEMLYGNIGGSSRLDFTVIGASVNEVTRLESLCKTNFPVLASEVFAQHISDEKMYSIGKRHLVGVQQEHEIFTLEKFIKRS